MATLSAERRLTVRVQRAWLKAAAGTSFPRRSRIDPIELGADWTHCMMIDLDDVARHSRFSYVGSALRDFSWPTFERQSVSECLEGSLLELATRHLATVAQKKEPLSFGGAAYHQDVNILYRTVLLPLSENGSDIDGVLAAIGYREFS